MIDTQRLGALLRALVRDDTEARLRTPAALAVRPVAAVGPELALPDAQRTPVPPQAAAQAAPPAASELDLSDTGRLLLSALRAQGAPLNGVTVPRSATQPVLNGRDGAQDRSTSASAAPPRPLVAVPPHSEYATDRLALQLKDAVEFSGVFYESHLAQWADDLRPRALLAHEPQARWPAAGDLARAPGAGDTAPADYATPLLRQQLEVLDSGRFVWSGELWPGQPGSLAIEEEDTPPRRDGDAHAPPARWRIRMTLNFAQLGAIDAAFTLAGDSVELGLRCDAPDVAQRLRAATPALRTAIAERALDLAQVSIDDGQAI